MHTVVRTVVRTRHLYPIRIQQSDPDRVPTLSHPHPRPRPRPRRKRATVITTTIIAAIAIAMVVRVVLMTLIIQRRQVKGHGGVLDMVNMCQRPHRRLTSPSSSGASAGGSGVGESGRGSGVGDGSGGIGSGSVGGDVGSGGGSGGGGSVNGSSAAKGPCAGVDQVGLY